MNTFSTVNPIIPASGESGEKTAAEERRDCPVRWTLALVGSCCPAYQETVMQDSPHTAMTPAAASVVSDCVWPHRQQPTRLLCPWDSPGENTGVGCHFLLQCMHACMLSCFSRVWLCATPWTTAHKALLSMEFSGQEYWSGLPFPSPSHEDAGRPGAALA